MKTTFKINWKRLSVLFLGMAVLLLAGSFAAASELGVSYWRADGTITGRGEELGNGAENFYSFKLSPIGLGPVALVSNLTLSDSTLKSLANAQQILDGSYTGETANLNFDAMAGLRLRLPSILGVSATGVIGYGGTAFAKVTPNSTETYRYAYFYGPRFRGELRYDIIGGMLYATAAAATRCATSE
ncbi:MAG: hypothetical protein IMW95_12410, partial [Moorella humiferrea]|nr:hypothetical protein [Moorella humiferrea]